MSRVSAGVSELTRRRPARRISGQEISAGVGLRSLRCSLGSAIKDVELGVEYRRVAAGIMSAMLFLAALVSITTWSSERLRQSFAEIHRHTASASGLPKAEKTQTAPPPASCKTGVSYNQGRQEAASLRATKVGNVAAALRAADLASAKPLVVRSRTRRAVGHLVAPLTARHRPRLPACAPPAPKEAWLLRL